MTYKYSYISNFFCIIIIIIIIKEISPSSTDVNKIESKIILGTTAAAISIMAKNDMIVEENKLKSLLDDYIVLRLAALEEKVKRKFWKIYQFNFLIFGGWLFVFVYSFYLISSSFIHILFLFSLNYFKEHLLEI